MKTENIKIATHCRIKGYSDQTLEQKYIYENICVAFMLRVSHDCFIHVCLIRELVEELHPLMKEALERRPEVSALS